MPILSEFYQITIIIYYNDHIPPHFHAKYGNYEITVDILTGLVEGRFPKQSLEYVIQWYDLHQKELIENWRLCFEKQPIQPIPSLEKLS